MAAAALALSFALLLLVGVAGPSAAKPALGPRGWAPGDLAWAPGPALVTALLWVAYLVGALGGRPAAARRAVGGLDGGDARPRRDAGEASPGPGWLGPAARHRGAGASSPDRSARPTTPTTRPTAGSPPSAATPTSRPRARWSALDPVTSAVEPPWTDTVSIYGPFATLLQSLTSHVAGANLRETVWLWQVLVVVAWLAVRFLLLRAGATPRRVDTLWTLNPLVFGVGVLGAHVDLVAAALAVAALVLAARSPLAAGAFAGLAVSCKVTYGVVAGGGAARRGGCTSAAGSSGGRRCSRSPRSPWSCRCTSGRDRTSSTSWTGPVGRSRWRRPWRLLFELLSGPLTSAHAPHPGHLAGGGHGARLRRRPRAGHPRTWRPGHRTGAAARWALVLSTAYTVAAPYSLPWYDLLTWAALPVLAASVLDAILLLRLAAMAVAYVPGRVVGMTPTVERVTLWVRRTPVPYAVLLVWGWLTLAATRGSSQTPEPRPPAP